MRTWQWLCGPVLLQLPMALAMAQEPAAPAPEPWRPPVLPRSVFLPLAKPADDAHVPWRANGLPLFRMPAAVPGGFLVMDPEPNSPGFEFDLASSQRQDDSTDRLVFSMGNDNPYYDFRRPGDPGGLGYQRLQTQLLLLERPWLGLSVGFNAVTPAGLENGGLREGPTVVSPSLTWVVTLTEDTSLQGFVGKNLESAVRLPDVLDGDLQYGLSLQRPIVGNELHIFVEALGRLRRDTDAGLGELSNVELLPGLHWRLSHRSWIAAGFLMPVNGILHTDERLWQITCSWQY